MADFLNIPKQALDKVINLGGTEKQILCKSCEKITKQVSISYSDMFAQDLNGFEEFFLSLNNYNPAYVIMLGNPFICTECCKLRLNGGLFSNSFNKANDSNSK